MIYNYIKVHCIAQILEVIRGTLPTVTVVVFRGWEGNNVSAENRVIYLRGEDGLVQSDSRVPHLGNSCTIQRTGYHRDQGRREDRDNCDNHQQLNQGER